MDTHNDMGMSMRQIFIERVGYKRATTRTILALLISLVLSLHDLV